ncbi:hypothetical protein N9W78_00845 [bacterium]|nr:hypothetical protein [bacterium]
MHTLLVTHAQCHLPAAVLQRLAIERLSDDNHFSDRLREHWLYHYDALLALHAQPDTGWSAAVDAELPNIASLRLAASLSAPFQVRLIESQQRYAALGLLAVHAAERLQAGGLPDAVRTDLSRLESRLHHCLAVGPKSHWHGSLPLLQRWRMARQSALLQLGRRQPELLMHSDNLLEALFTQTDPLVPAGAHLNLSYAGPSSELRQWPIFQRWHQHRVAQGGSCWLSEMDASSAQACGAGALSLAWISAPARRETP